MKKLLAVLLAVGSAIGVYAGAYVHSEFTAVCQSVTSNFTTKDQVVVDKASAYINSIACKTDGEKFALLRLHSFVLVQKPQLPSFTEYKAAIDAKIAELKFQDPMTDGQYLSALENWRIAEYYKPMYEFMKTKNFDPAQFQNSGFYADKNGKSEEAYNYYKLSNLYADRAAEIAIFKMKNPAMAFEAVKLLINRDYPAPVMKKMVAILVNNLVGNPAIKDAEMKDLLQRINRKYSAKLIADKATWEPIIAQIRTVLETY